MKAERDDLLHNGYTETLDVSCGRHSSMRSFVRCPVCRAAKARRFMATRPGCGIDGMVGLRAALDL
jgi:hypothetical protein